MANNIKLTIEGQVIEVVEDTIDMDYQITDIATGAVDSDRSFPIIAPRTQANNLAFGHLHDFSIANELPFRKLAATLDDGGTPLLKNGICRIKKSGRAYELELGGGNYSFLDIVNELKIQELDFSEFDHFWTLDQVHASRTNTAGYIYLVNDYFIDPDTSPIDNIDRVIRADYIYPCTFVHTILTKMAEYANITLSGDFIESQAYKDLVLPFMRRDYRRNLNGDRYRATFTLFSDIVASSPFPVLALFSFQSSIANYFTATNTSNYSFATIQLADNIDVTLDLVLQVEKLSSGNGTLVVSFDYSDGFAINQVQRVVAITPGLNEYKLSLDLSIIGVDIDQSLVISFQSSSSAVLVQSNSTVTLKNINVRAGDPVVYSNTLRTKNYVTLNTSLPEITCGTLLKALANMYGLLFQYNKETNTIQVEQLGKVYENMPIADDWTDKIDPTTAIVEYELGSFGQINRMLLTNPEAMDPLLGSYVFTIPNEHLPPEKEVFKLPFQFTENVTRLEDLTLAHIPIIAAEDNPDAPPAYLYSLSGESKPRIVTVSRETPGGDDLDYYDGTSSLSSSIVPLGYFYRAGASNNIDLNSLINTYQAARIVMLQKGKKVTLDVDLLNSDIASLDFFIPVYIRTWAKYFYKNRIGRQTKGLSKAILVEL